MAKTKQERDAKGRFLPKDKKTNGSSAPFEGFLGNRRGVPFPMPLGNGPKSSGNPYVDMLVNTVRSIRSSGSLLDLIDERRDIDVECGYKDNITARDYKRMYNREGIPKRIIEIWPKESWKVMPEVYEVEDETETEFEKAFQEMANQVGQIEESHFKSKNASPFWKCCKRADICSGIGSFGAIYLGLSDADSTDQLLMPVAGLEEEGEEAAPATDDLKLNFMQVFDETQITISKYNQNPNSPRFNRPEIYEFQLFDTDERRTTEKNYPVSTLRVHWSRVIHVADNRENNDLFGAPRLESLWNRAYDLVKYFGAGAEGFWKGGFPGLSVESIPELGGDIEFGDEERDDVKQQMDAYQNKLQRYLLFLGLKVTSLAPQVVPFDTQFDAVLTFICATIGVPKPIFLGHETGELNSTQNAKSWRESLMDRQESYLTPELIRPIIDRLIKIRVLPEPKQGYSIRWPSQTSLSQAEQASVSNQIVNALIKYVNSGLVLLISPEDFLIKIMKFDGDMVADILKDAKVEKLVELAMAKLSASPKTGTGMAKTGQKAPEGSGEPGVGYVDPQKNEARKSTDDATLARLESKEPG